MAAYSTEKDIFCQHMNQNKWVLGGLLIFAGLFVSWLTFFCAPTVSNRLVGTIGILLGLYIGSHPAANMLDILLFMKADVRESIVSSNLGRFWLLLNILTGIASWFVVFISVLRFVAKY